MYTTNQIAKEPTCGAREVGAPQMWRHTSPREQVQPEDSPVSCQEREKVVVLEETLSSSEESVSKSNKLFVKKLRKSTKLITEKIDKKLKQMECTNFDETTEISTKSKKKISDVIESVIEHGKSATNENMLSTSSSLDWLEKSEIDASFDNSIDLNNSQESLSEIDKKSDYSTDPWLSQDSLPELAIENKPCSTVSSGDCSTSQETRQNDDSDSNGMSLMMNPKVLHVGNIPEGTSREYLRSRFCKFGTIIEIATHFREIGRHYANVKFYSKEEVTNAMENGNDGEDIKLILNRQKIFVHMDDNRQAIYVGNIPFGTTQSDLRARFEKFGTIKEVAVHFREWAENYGFVTFTTAEEVNKAVLGGNEGHFLKYKIRVGKRKPFRVRTYRDFDAKAGQARSTRDPVEGDFDSLLREMKSRKDKPLV